METAEWLRKVPWKAWTWGGVASISLLGIYLLVLGTLNSFSHAVQQFLDLWYWMVPLILGFGLQIALFVSLRHHSRQGMSSAVFASGGMSTSSMVACCAHHVTEVLPLLGFSAASMLLVQYQSAFLAFGLASTIIGVLFMLREFERRGMPLANIGSRTLPAGFAFGMVIILGGVIMSL